MLGGSLWIVEITYTLFGYIAVIYLLLDNLK